jgi:hypothetical protein
MKYLTTETFSDLPATRLQSNSLSIIKNGVLKKKDKGKILSYIHIHTSKLGAAE